MEHPSMLNRIKEVDKRSKWLAGKAFILICMLLFSSQVFAGTGALSIADGKQKTSFSFRLINNLIIVPVVLDDSLKASFILDTGVRNTILFDSSGYFNKHRSARQVLLAGAGKGHNINAFVVEDVNISFPGIVGTGHQLVVLEDDLLQLSSHLGTAVHGIIGFDFFNAFSVEINYIRKRITVYQTGTYAPGRRDQSMPIHFFQQRPYIYADIVQYQGPSFTAELLIDSGASHGIMLEKDSKDSIHLPEKHLETIIGWGLGGEVQGYLGRIEELDIAGFSFSDMLASFTKDYSSPVVFEESGRNGSIGGELLSRFTTTYDYAGQTLYLRRNNQFRRNFEFNLSGIDLIAEGKDYTNYKVVHVIEGSPADQAGILPGDLIIKADSKFAAQMSLSELNTLLRSRSGRQIELVIYRDKNYSTVRFRLKRLI